MVDANKSVERKPGFEVGGREGGPGKIPDVHRSPETSEYINVNGADPKDEVGPVKENADGSSQTAELKAPAQIPEGYVPRTGEAELTEEERKTILGKVLSGDQGFDPSDLVNEILSLKK